MLIHHNYQHHHHFSPLRSQPLISLWIRPNLWHKPPDRIVYASVIHAHLDASVQCIKTCCTCDLVINLSTQCRRLVGFCFNFAKKHQRVTFKLHSSTRPVIHSSRRGLHTSIDWMIVFMSKHLLVSISCWTILGDRTKNRAFCTR